MADEVQTQPGASTPPPAAASPEPKSDWLTPPKPAAPPVATVQAAVAPEATPPNSPEQGAPPAEAPKEAERVVPEHYDLKLPQDAVLDSQALARLESYARTQKLTQEEAAELVTRQEQDVRHALEERKAAWLKETQSDREIGGENLAKNVETANRFLDKYMPAELRADLNRTGYGNNRHFMRFVLDMAKRSSNDTLVTSQSVASPVQRSTADMLYGNTNKR